jgi:hypothetical protein
MVKVTLTPGSATCSKNIINAIVYTIGIVSINFSPKNTVVNGTPLYLMINMGKYYPTDPNTTNINPSINFSNLTGSYNFYINFPINGFNISMLMPPSTQPILNFITVKSYILNNGNQIFVDNCFINIDGISPNTLNNALITGGNIQSLSNMNFTFTIQTPFFIN